MTRTERSLAHPRALISALMAAMLAVATPLSSTAFAADPAPRSEAVPSKVQVSVMVIYATKAHSRKDPRIGDLLRYFEHLDFTGYELLDTHEVQLSAGSEQSFAIEGGRKVSVEMLEADARSVKIRVQLTAAKGVKLLDTTGRVNRNGTFMVAGPKYQDGILVLPVTARY